MATPTVVGTRAASSEYTGTSCVISTPSAATASSTLFAWFTAADWVTLSGMQAPSGWTLVGSNDPGSGPPKGKWFMRPESASAPAASYTFTKSNAAPASIIMLAIDGVDHDDPIDVTVAWDDQATTTTTLTSPSRTSTQVNTLLICGWAATPYVSGSEDDQWSATVASTDGTVRTTTTDYQAQLVAWDELVSAGASGTRTGTFSSTSGSAVGKLSSAFVIRGAAATGAPQTMESGLVTEVELAHPSLLTVEGQEEEAGPRTTPISLVERKELLEASTVNYSLSRVEVLSETDAIEIEDISNDVVGCRIEHGSFRQINRTIDIDLIRELDWGRHRVKPYITIEGGGWNDTLPMGVFCLTAPMLVGGVRPPTFAVQGYDKSYLLDQALASPVSYPIGQPVLAAVRDLLALRGMQSDRIDNSRATDTLTDVRAWAVEQGVTYLQVINDLLAMVGYRELRIDPEGFPESGPYPTADQRPVMWRYDADHPMTTVYLSGREHIDDYTNRPNRWVFWQNQTERETPPEEGDGLYIFDNLSQGRSSQTARGGLVITKAEAIEALTQADLEVNGNRIIAQDIQSSATVRFTTTLNPYHDHQDVMEVIDRDLGIAGPFESMVWTLDVFGRSMTHEVRSIPGGIA